MEINVSWTDLKNFAVSRKSSIQWIVSNDTYFLWAIDGPIEVSAQIPILDPVPDESDQLDFESNFKNSGNKTVLSQVVTQYELNDKILKLAKGKGEVDENGQVKLYFKVPGQFGSGNGRFLAGGYGISEDYNKDDYVVVKVEDKDRLIAWMIAQFQDPNAAAPIPDEYVQQMGIIPGIDKAFPLYPVIASYTDEEADSANQGWYFWPLAMGNNLPPAGEVEVNPIGGYGFAPSGFYITLIYQRPDGIITGSFRANFDWGKKE